MSAIDLTKSRRIHIIGVGGAGMAAIAHVLHAMGHHVTGSDLTASAAFDRLVNEGVAVVIGHAAENLGDAEIVARSTAIPDHNVEVEAFYERGGTVLRRAELLGAITSSCRTVAVAGTHGKTTTSSMLAVMLLAADVDPSFIIGGDVTQLGTGAAWGNREFFVVEADESDGSFLELGHSVGLVTNVEPDHLEHYGGEPQLRAAFVQFAQDSETTIVCLDDEGAAELAALDNVVTYGQDPSADYQLAGLERSAAGSSFSMVRRGSSLGRVTVPMPGLHNARNACGAAATALEMGVPFEAITRGLASFGGVGRRFHHRGETAGIQFVDDYAHLPTEVASAIDAATDLGRERIVTVFQPHRYSRTQALWQDFVGAFDQTDLLIVTGIYSSGEAPREGVTGHLIVDAVATGGNPPETVYIDDRAGLAAAVLRHLHPGDLCLTLGAGDLVTLADEAQELLRSGQ